MYYETLKTLIEDEFKISGFDEDATFQALDILNSLSEHEDRLSNSKEIITVAAIAFLVFEQNGNFKNFREIAHIFGTDAKKIALKAKEIALILNIDNFEEIMTKGLSIFELPKQETIKVTKTVKKEVINDKESKSSGKDINDDELHILLKSFMKFAYQLFKNKEYVEIKLFLKIFENNLNLAGFDTKKTNIEERFGNIFYQLGFEPKKGREPEKFVKLKDRFGQSEPYSLIKLGE